MSHASEPIRLVVTGGTFDKEYDEIGGRLFFKDTHVSEMLRLGRATIDIKVQTLMMIDSLDMTDTDRKKILEYVTNCAEDHIVITHGTDTMATTAHTLGQANLKKTIILTGAMVPYKFGSSDGLFNLGASLAFAQTQPHGVYVAMNGRSLPWNNVTKNKVTGEFGPL